MDLTQEYFRSKRHHLKKQGLEHIIDDPIRGLDGVSKAILQMQEISPRIQQFFKGMLKWNKMGVADQQTFDEISDNFPTVEWEKVATVPVEIHAILMKVAPEILDDPTGKALEKWLKTDAGRPYATPPDARRRHRRVSIRGGLVSDSGSPISSGNGETGR